MKSLLFNILILLAGFTILQSCNNMKASATDNVLHSKAYAKKIKLLPAATLVDVRTPKEFAEGHLVGAINVDWKNENFVNEITAVDKSNPVLVYCRSGMRSAAAAEKMRELGFVKVYDLAGGILQWKKDKMPVVKPVVDSATIKIE